MLMQSDFSIEYKDQKEVYEQLIHHLRNFFAKCGFKKAVLGLSGGLDSTICAVLLADALGAENVVGISLPSKLTPDTSNSDAKELAGNLGINYQIVPIAPIVDQFNAQLNNAFSNLDKDFSKAGNSFTQDNLQARSRATILYAVSNQYESMLPIATSDKSEIYMGYGTLNGDLSGVIAPLADVCKTELFSLGYWMNENRQSKNGIPVSILKKRPSAELAIDPATNKLLCAEDALMPYEFIDEIIWLIENKKLTQDEILNVSLTYTKKYNIVKAQQNEWIAKFFHRMRTQHFKLALLPPAICLRDNSYLKSCNKVYSGL